MVRKTLNFLSFIVLSILFFSIQTKADQPILKSGWYLWDPYQYLKTPNDPDSLTGLDVELQKQILKKAGFDVSITPVSWKEHQNDLRTGKRDVAMGAFYSDERAEFAYISEPYRFEENSLFTLREKVGQHTYSNLEEFLKYIPAQKPKIGIVKGYRYADETLNAFIQDPKNKDFFIASETDNQNLELLLQGQIDGFLADRIVGATVIWRNKVGSKLSEKRLNIKAPIYMLMSKKTISQTTRNKINQAIVELKQSPEYAQTVSWYLYPVLLMETTDSYWFRIIELIGTIAFALSGLVVAYRCNASLFGTFILSLLPSFGGGILRDVIFGRYPIWFMQARFYILLVLSVVAVKFFIVRYMAQRPHALDRFFKSHKLKPVDVFDNLLVITDAIGLAAFTVTGVLVSLIVKADPLWLWGPFFAFLTGAGGGMLRDIVAQSNQVGAIHGEIYPEVAILWGFILSMFLTLTVDSINPSHIEIAVIVTIISAFLTRMIIHFGKIPNIFILGRQLS